MKYRTFMLIAMMSPGIGWEEPETQTLQFRVQGPGSTCEGSDMHVHQLSSGGYMGVYCILDPDKKATRYLEPWFQTSHNPYRHGGLCIQPLHTPSNLYRPMEPFWIP